MILLKKTRIPFIVFFLMASIATAMDISSISMPDVMIVDGEKLVLNGAGIRKKFVIDLYAIGLYLKTSTNDAQYIVDSDETMALRLNILTNLITSERFTAATLRGFKKSTNDNIAPIQKEIEQFLEAFANKINNRDIFVIEYHMNNGIFVYKNNRAEPEVCVKGLDLKKAIFELWIGDRAQNHLQILSRELLGIID